MRHCSNCGYEIGIGRYCTNCGLPVDSAVDDVADSVGDEDAVADRWRTDTAERSPLPRSLPSTAAPSASPPRTPPPAPAGSGVPGSPRYPLFADEVDLSSPPAYSPGREPAPYREPRRWPLWLAIAATLLVVAGFGFKLLTDDESGTAAAPSTGASSTPPGKKHGPGSQRGSVTPAPAPVPGAVTADATVAVPATAPAGQDLEGNPVDYDAANMLDGIPETTWRMAGDGTGKELTITLPGETTLRSVGLINGYAKTVPGARGGQIDWYHGNRRIVQVEWVFDDGSTVSQSLGDSAGVQSIDVDATTTSIVLRLVAVSPPGGGPSARNYTAISDLQLIGTG